MCNFLFVTHHNQTEPLVRSIFLSLQPTPWNWRGSILWWSIKTILTTSIATNASNLVLACMWQTPQWWVYFYCCMCFCIFVLVITHDMAAKFSQNWFVLYEVSFCILYCSLYICVLHWFLICCVSIAFHGGIVNLRWNWWLMWKKSFEFARCPLLL